ncbi:MAG: hypothetical protein PHW53_04705 [Patescibacteria group bacterium]|nr:hypothetical protein [Patescibacteria group bacterium]
MSVKGTIINNLVTGLKTILKARGYATDVKLVERYEIPYDTDAKDVPFIAVVEIGKTLLAEDADDKLWQLSLTLIPTIRLQSLLAQGLDEFTDDIENYVDSSPALGANCLSIMPLSIENVYLSQHENTAAAQMPIEIIYYSPKSGA